MTLSLGIYPLRLQIIVRIITGHPQENYVDKPCLKECSGAYNLYLEPRSVLFISSK